jgi:hypothetical protein
MHKIRRTDREISFQEASAVLSAGEYGFLATIGSDGQPYGVPLNYVFQDDCIYFHCATEGHKLDNIRYNQKVSFCVVGRTNVLPEQFATEYESVIVFGSAAEVNGPERYNALVALLEKYSPRSIEAGKAYIERNDRATQVIKITIDRMSGKARR